MNPSLTNICAMTSLKSERNGKQTNAIFYLSIFSFSYIWKSVLKGGRKAQFGPQSPTCVVMGSINSSLSETYTHSPWKEDTANHIGVALGHRGNKLELCGRLGSNKRVRGPWFPQTPRCGGLLE